MAEIRPLKAWRYNPSLTPRIEELTSPLFDVLTQRQREALYNNPLNSIHLSVPNGVNAAAEAARTLAKWKGDGTLLQDRLPGIYVYYQYFSLPGRSGTFCRKGFVANLKIYEWHEEVLLGHENTMPHSVNDRMEILRGAELNVSPTHGLYTDPTHEIEGYLDESITDPLYETEDYQGVKDVFSVIHDARVISRIIEILKDQQIILADGHHRYGGSLSHMRMRRDANPNHTGFEPYNYHLMYFTNTESDDLRILPTHRVVSGLPHFEERQFIEKLSTDFTIRQVENAEDINEVILGKQWAYGILIGENAYKVQLKPERFTEMPDDLPTTVRELDLSVMHYFIFEKILDIPLRDQPKKREIRFERNFTQCHREAIKGEIQVALITRDIPIETVKAVCRSGHTLPPKSTYFYPKVICGFLFGSINENEFYSPLDPGFQLTSQESHS